MATLWERAANSFNRMYVINKIEFLTLIISRFGFIGMLLVLIVPEPGHC